jgi:methylmalonyl-CoA/ethylmalonyl-CoA epimerase
MPGLVSIDHIGIAVHDLDKAIEWYSEFFGAILLNREFNDDQMIEEATLEVGGSNFQIITPKGELSPVKKFLTSRGQGLQQIAFQVTNLESATNFSVKMGVRVIFDSAKVGAGGSKINFLHPKDCFGVLIELVELHS